MIPPRLAHQLQNLITRKLLESSAFNEFVARTDGAFHSIRLGLKEGWQEGSQESASHPSSSDDGSEKPTSNKSEPRSTDRRQTFHSASADQEPKTEPTDQEKKKARNRPEAERLTGKASSPAAQVMNTFPSTRNGLSWKSKSALRQLYRTQQNESIDQLSPCIFACKSTSVASPLSSSSFCIKNTMVYLYLIPASLYRFSCPLATFYLSAAHTKADVTFRVKVLPAIIDLARISCLDESSLGVPLDSPDLEISAVLCNSIHSKSLEQLLN